MAFPPPHRGRLEVGAVMAIEQVLVSQAALRLAELEFANPAGKPIPLPAVTVAGARNETALNSPPPAGDGQYPANDIDHGRSRRSAELPLLNAGTEPR